MTIAFDRPVRIPPIEIYNISEATSAANLTSLIPGGASRGLLDGDTASDGKNEGQSDDSYFRNLTIQEVLELRVDSPYLDEEEEQGLILDYKLTRFNVSSFDVQVEFDKSREVPHSLLEPDQLIIRFKDKMLFRGLLDVSQLFVDEIDFEFHFEE